MKIKEQKPAAKSAQQNLVNVGDNLYRSSTSDIYYAIFKRDGKQIRQSLHTTDKELARRKVADMRAHVDQLNTGDDGKIAFAVLDANGKVVGGLLRQYIDNKLGNLCANSRETNVGDTKTFAAAFSGQPVRNITLKNVETWAAKRRQEVHPETFNRQLGLLRRIFAYAVKHGIRLDNPATKDKIERQKNKNIQAAIPTRNVFVEWVTEIRNRSDEAADFTEAMGLSGCRVGEIGGSKKWGYPALTWGNINFSSGTFTVTGKGRKTRTVPLFPAFRELLLRRKAKLPEPPDPSDRVFEIEDPRMSMITACKNLGWHPKRFTPHDCRHFFCSNCIELGIDFKVIAAWLGHSDGGILVARTYGHLRQEHSMQKARVMTWSVDQKPASNIIDMPTQSKAGSKAMAAVKKLPPEERARLLAELTGDANATGTADAVNSK